MALQIIRTITDIKFEEKLTELAKKLPVVESWQHIDKQTKRLSLSILTHEEDTQKILDRLENVCGRTSNTHILVLPVSAAVSPEIRKRVAAEQKRQVSSKVTIPREELYANVVKGTKLDANFILLIIISTIVAAIGLLENHTTVIIGAMLIAPLLGPNLAMCFATILGDLKLMGQAVRTNLVGIAVCLAIAFFIGLVWPYGFDSVQLMFRTDVGYDGLVLALASGAAAALSLTAGLSSALVGVMVSAALLPPTVVLGIMLGAADFHHVTGAALLLATNIVSINLVANLVFLYKGIHPNRWYEKQKAKKAIFWNFIFWIILLLLLGVMIYLRHGFKFFEIFT
jgi:uncharacterized hydrophobic protein (TIGR00341 family)